MTSEEKGKLFELYDIADKTCRDAVVTCSTIVRLIFETTGTREFKRDGKFLVIVNDGPIFSFQEFDDFNKAAAFLEKIDLNFKSM